MMAELSTCVRRKVGCVLVDPHDHIIGVGYNGVPAGRTHCTDTPCSGARFASGQGLDECEATHAEANALLQCRDVQAIESVYVTVSPCIQCVKFLMNTSAKRVIFSKGYPHQKSKEMWKSSGKSWNHIPGLEDGKWIDDAEVRSNEDVLFRMRGLEK